MHTCKCLIVIRFYVHYTHVSLQVHRMAHSIHALQARTAQRWVMVEKRIVRSVRRATTVRKEHLNHPPVRRM